MAPRPSPTTDTSHGHAAMDVRVQTAPPQSFAARVLVTGSAGFVGFHLVRFLVANYPAHLIVGLDRQEPRRDLFETPPPSNYKFVRGSITSKADVRALLRSERITAVVHCAALSHVSDSFGNALAFTDANVVGTHVLLEAVRALQQELELQQEHEFEFEFTRFVLVSSVSVYGNGGSEMDDMDADRVIKEDALLAPTTPYAASKASAEMLVKAYYESFKVPTVTVRSCNVFGPYQPLGVLIPNSIDRLLHGKPVLLNGDGLQTRQYVFIEDMVRALDVVLRDGHVGEVYNISTKTLISNATVALDTAKLVHPHLAMEDATQQCLQFVPGRPSDGRQTRIDSSKLRAIGWAPHVEWREGLGQTVTWWKTQREQQQRAGSIDDGCDAAAAAH